VTKQLLDKDAKNTATLSAGAPDPGLYVSRQQAAINTCLPSLLRIGADSMGAIGPTDKKLWGRCHQVAPTGTLLSFLKPQNVQ